MPIREQNQTWRRVARSAMVVLTLSAVLAGGTGVGCDAAASATFRDTATGAIGSGVKTILSGVVDGVVAAIEDANSESDNDASTTE